MLARCSFVFVVILAGCSRTPTLPPDKAALRPIGFPVAAEIQPAYQSGVQQATALSPVIDQPRLKVIPGEVVIDPPAVRPFDRWSEQEAVADALGRIGTAAVPALIETLHRPETEARLQAIEVLGRMGSDAKDAVPDLIRLLDDPDLQIRKAAARTLGRIGPEAAAAVPALMRSLIEPTPKIPADREL